MLPFAALRKLFSFAAIVLAVLSAASVTRADDPFKVIVIPDTQRHASQGYPHVFNSQIQYAVDQNAAFLIGLGDMVDDGADISHWNIADAAYQIADNAGLSYGVACGNHDYNDMSDYLDPTNFRNYFGPSRFAGKPWEHGYKSLTGGDVMNAYHVFQNGGRSYMVLFLEMCANDSALAWAQGVVDTHPGIPIMVAMHQYLDQDLTGSNRRVTTTERARTGDTTANSPQTIWHEFIKVNPQIFMVLSGHHHPAGHYTQINNNQEGLPVYQIVQNWQELWGTGWLRELTFIPDEDKIEVRSIDVYSGVTELHTCYLDFEYLDYAVIVDGDVDGDGFVGGDDLTVILTNWGRFGMTRRQGDLTGDGFVTGDDYTEVLTYWGTGIPPQSVITSVPEPATLGLLLLGGLVLLRRKRSA